MYVYKKRYCRPRKIRETPQSLGYHCDAGTSYGLKLVLKSELIPWPILVAWKHGVPKHPQEPPLADQKQSHHGWFAQVVDNVFSVLMFQGACDV